MYLVCHRPEVQVEEYHLTTVDRHVDQNRRGDSLDEHSIGDVAVSLLSKIFSSVGGDIVASVGKIIDDTTTSTEEKLAKKNELTRILAEAQQKAAELEFNYERELTERLRIDMTSDSWLSKNVRPLTLIYLLIVVSVLAVTDGNLAVKFLAWDIDWSFHVRDLYITLFSNLLLSAVSFYFISRGFEKRAKMQEEKGK